MKRDRVLGLAIAGLSLLLAVITALFYAIQDGRIPLAVFALPALGLIVGGLIFFFNIVQTTLYIDDEIEQLPALLQDDLDAARRRTFNATHFYAGFTVLAFVIQMFLVIWYRKAYAAWGPLNVLVTALIVSAVAFVVAVRSDLFQDRRRRFTAQTFLIPAVGWFICIVIGIRYAEPVEWGGLSRIERAQLVETGFVASVQRTASRESSDALDLGSDILSLGDFGCDDEGCLVLLLLVVVVILVIASAAIPHFWVVACSLLLTIMVTIALRELLFVDKPADHKRHHAPQ